MITVTGVDITDGVHRVHMTADIRLPETQPQEVPPPVGEPTFVEVRDVPGVVTQLSLDLVAPPTDPVTEPAAAPGEGTSLTERGRRARSGILEESGPQEQEDEEAYAPKEHPRGGGEGRPGDRDNRKLRVHSPSRWGLHPWPH